MASFGVFCRLERVDERLASTFSRLKSSWRVVYPMGAQLRLLLDANVAGEGRVFGVEALASDPLFVRLAGGSVPSIDTLYRDLERFDDEAITSLEEMMFETACRLAVRRDAEALHIDIDPTVMPLFGAQQGAAVGGANARHAGRASYHPILAYCPELGACVGAQLRPGDTGLGNDDAVVIESWVRRFRDKVGTARQLTVRIDGAADCVGILTALQRSGARFITKAQLTPNLKQAIAQAPRWRTVDYDADGRPLRQVADVDFQRELWVARGVRFRVIAVRMRDSETRKQTCLWPDQDWSVEGFITNDELGDADDIAHEYNDRAEIEPVIAELKGGWAIGKIPSQVYDANQALFLLKLLAHNLVRGFTHWASPALARWRVPWVRRRLITLPGRLLRSGRQWTLRVPPHATLRLE